MAKKTDIAQVFIWASNILDTNQLTIAEQATFFNLIKLINRNFWKPIKISSFKLARTMCSDKRTIEKALKSLTDKKIIYMQEGVIFIGYTDENTFKSLISGELRAESDSVSGEFLNSKRNFNRNRISDTSANGNRETISNRAGISDGNSAGISDGNSDTGTTKTLADFL